MDVTWPPGDDESALLTVLATLIERGGAGRLLDGPVARADERDFPEPWQPTAMALARLLSRVLWLAHVDLDVALDDIRPADDDGGMLRKSAITWTGNEDGAAYFSIEAIGNDNVAGLVCHEVGRAYAAWAASGTAYRDDADGEVSARVGSVAAVYLGLGVVAANAALYHRTAGKLVGRMAVTERDVVMAGGLSPAELVYLLAVQAVLRDAPIAAHDTLRPELREHLQTMVASLAPHRAALAERLGVDLDAPRTALSRDPAPAEVAANAYPEPQRRLRNAHLRTYRVRHTPWVAWGLIGIALGFAAVLVGVVIAQHHAEGWHVATALPLGAIGGAVFGARRGVDRCARCVTVMAIDATACAGCGGTIAGRLAHPADLHARELELDEDAEQRTA